jgi:hypothetical protein
LLHDGTELGAPVGSLEGEAVGVKVGVFVSQNDSSLLLHGSEKENITLWESKVSGSSSPGLHISGIWLNMFLNPKNVESRTNSVTSAIPSTLHFATYLATVSFENPKV